MNTDQLRSQISKCLMDITRHAISRTAAENGICRAFKQYAEARNLPINGTRKRIKDAIKDFVEDVNPQKPGEAIHDAIDHIMNG